MPVQFQCPSYFSLAWLKTQATEVEGGILVPALLFTEGEFIDGNGKEGKYTKKNLDQIVKGTLAYHQSGQDIPIFESNHDFGTEGYTNSNKIGLLSIDAGLTVERITEDNLPDPRLTELIGKWGIFGHGLITRTDAIERYHQLLIRPLSIAFDPSGEFTEGNKYAIFEVSAVPWGAVPGARFFGKFPASDFAEDKPNGDSKPRLFALTLDGAIAEMDRGYEGFDEPLMEVLWAFESVIRNVRNTTAEELQGRDRMQLMRAAIDDLSERLRDVLGVGRDAPPPVSLNSRGVQMADEPNTPVVTPEPESPPVEDSPDTTDLLARIEALEAANQASEERATKAEAETAELKELQVLGDRVQALKDRASAALKSGRMTPAKFKQLFPEAETLRNTALRFFKPVEGDKFSGEAGLIRLETAIEAAEELEPMKFGSVLQDGLGDNPHQNQQIDEGTQNTIKTVAKRAAANRAY